MDLTEAEDITPVFLPGESQGWGSLVGCRLWGHTESVWAAKQPLGNAALGALFA